MTSDVVIAIVVSVIATVPLPLRGQSSDELIHFAELAASKHPSEHAPDSLRSSFGRDVAGSPQRKCVGAAGTGPIRSGEFVIGGELGGRQPLLSRSRAKIWWAPLHRSLTMDSLVVHGTRLTEPGSTFRYSSGDVAYPSHQRSLPEPERDYFFPTGFTIPSSGRWLIVVTSGSNWGCFIMTVI